MKRRAAMSDEVKAAVNDILHGTSVDSSTEWLQREYIRLMRREAANRANMEAANRATIEAANRVSKESKLSSNVPHKDGGVASKDWPTE